MRRFLFNLILLVLFFSLAAAISLNNQFEITLNLLVTQTVLKASTLIAVMLGLGFVFGIFSFMSSYLSLRFRYRKISKELQKKIKPS